MYYNFRKNMNIEHTKNSEHFPMQIKQTFLRVFQLEIKMFNKNLEVK